MVCKFCGEEYDPTLFPVCPFCLNPPGEKGDSEDSNADSKLSQDLENKRDDYIRKDDVPIAENSETLSPANKTDISEEIPLEDCSESTSEESDNRTIAEVFWENKFNLFVKYCSRENIVFIRDLNEDVLANVAKIKGVGAGKIKDIVNRFNDFCNGDIIIANTAKENIDRNRPLFTSIHKELENLSISLLSGLGVKNRAIEILQYNGITQIGGLSKITESDANDMFTKHFLDRVPYLREQLQKPIIELLGDVLNQFSETEEYQLSVLKAEGYTLQSLGDTRNLTRERVRQKIEKFNHLLDPLMEALARPYFLDKNYVTVQELIDIYDNDEYDKIILYWFRKSDSIQYLPFADAFVTNDWDTDKTNNDLLSIAEDYIGDGIFLDDCIEDIVSEAYDDGYRFINADTFAAFILENGYRIYGGYAIKGNQSYGYLSAKVIAKYFPNGIKLYDHESLDMLRKYTYKEFGDIGISESDRAFSSRVASYTVLCGRGSVTAIENLQIDMSLLDTIKQYIDSSKEANIYYSTLFAEYEGMIRMMSNIDNHHFLHGVLKWFYSDEYDFSSKDYLHKSGKEFVTVSFAEKLTEFLSRKGEPATKKEIQKAFPGITDIMLSTTVTAKNQIYKCEHNKYYSIDLIAISEEELFELRNRIEQIQFDHCGCCSSRLLYEKAIDLSLLQENAFITPEHLFFLCAQLFSGEFDFGRPNICAKGRYSPVSTAEVALELLGHPSELNYRDYIKVAEIMMWSPMTVFFAFLDISKQYCRIDKENYVIRSHFTITESELCKIDEVIDSQLDNGFMSIINYDNWEIFPTISYDWNCYLLRSIVDNMLPMYRIVETRMRDRRYERGIIIKANSNIVDYEDLVVDFLKNSGRTVIPESEMLSLLVVNDLTFKVIPEELYKGRNILYKNESFYIGELDAKMNQGSEL